MDKIFFSKKKIIFNKLKNIKKNECIKNEENEKKLTKDILVFNRIGEESKNGEVLKGCMIKKDNSCLVNFALKKIPLENNVYKYISKPNAMKTLNKSSTFSELFFLKKLNKLIDQRICINIPYLYKYFICDTCEFSNPMIDKYFFGTNKCLIIVNDLADTILSSFLDTNPSFEVQVNAYLQIYIALYCIRKFFNIWHHDLHGDNVLVYKVKPGGFWQYIINGRKCNIPNIGYLFVLTDFGYSRIPGKIEPEDLSWIYKKENEKDPLEDYIRISTWLYNTGPRLYSSGEKSSRGGNSIVSIDKQNIDIIKHDKIKIYSKDKTGDVLGDFLIQGLRKTSVFSVIYKLTEMANTNSILENNKILIVLDTDKKLK